MKQKLLSFILSLFIGSLFGQCDFTIIGWNSDNPDQILIQANANIPPNTTYYITDNEWIGGSFNSGEQIATFSTNSSTTILSGSTILIEAGSATCGTFGGSLPALAVGGDEIYITNVNPSGAVAAANICFAASLGVSGGGGGTMPSNSISTAFDNGSYSGTGDVTLPANWTFNDNLITLPVASCQVSLPVKLVDFSVQQIKNDIELKWQTATEINNSHFNIEHSVDGSKFEVIASVKGSGSSYKMNNYKYTHSQVEPGMHFYRLTQIDFDGQSESFDIKSVNLGKEKTFKAYPSEVTDFLIIENPYEEVIKVYSILGKFEMQIQKENKIDLSNLSPGIYLLKSSNETIKFRKL